MLLYLISVGAVGFISWVLLSFSVSYYFVFHGFNWCSQL